MKNRLRNTLLFVAGSIVVAGLLGAPPTARAAGLGELHLHSGLGQPLNAEIEIVALQAGELDLQARLAPALRQGGADLDPALSAVRFRIVENGARSVLRVSTSQPLLAPYLDLPVELSFGTTRVVRQYTLLLDPPSSKHIR